MQTRKFFNSILTVLAPFSPFAPLAQAIGKRADWDASLLFTLYSMRRELCL